MSIADQVRLAADPYTRAIALMSYRSKDLVTQTVTMFFEDYSHISFQIRYEVLP